jgi:gliding motility-associated-like protein
MSKTRISFILTICFFHCWTRLACQVGFNIVPNPSYNLIFSCPAIGPKDDFEGYLNWLPKRVHVYDTNNILIDIIDSGTVQFGSPNPYHFCNSYYSEHCAPLDLDGGGGVGMGINYNTILPYREFSVVKLTTPLLPYQNYCISFYVANCSSPIGTGSADLYFLNKQMVGFSNEPFPWTNPDHSDYRSYLRVGLQNETIFTDTSVWHKIQGNYLADGSEAYLFLGWAEPTSNMAIFIADDVPGINYGSAYNLFDSISVVQCDEMGMNIDNLEIPNAISPNGDGINDTWNLNNGNPLPPNLEVQIFNRWGTQVYQNTNYANEWNGTNQNGDNVTDGVFFYVIQLPPNQKKAGFIYVFR